MRASSSVKAIIGVSKKIDLDKESLQKLINGRKAGVAENQLIAEMLHMPEGGDPDKFLESKLSPEELEVLKSILHNLTSKF
jgi:hypothetical protein